MKSRDVDVLVVGAGPTGLIAALWLRRLGVEVMCIDKLSEPSIRPKGNCVQTRTIELLSVLGIAEPLIDRGQIATHSTSYFDGEEIFSRTFLDLLTDSAFGAVLWTSQADVERVMTEALAAAGGTLRRGSEIVALDVRADDVVCTIRTGSVEEQVRARWVIGADGSHSTVRELLGVQRGGRDFPQRWIMATVRLAPPMPPDQESTFYAHGKPVLYIDPGPDGWVRLVTMSLDPQFDPTTATQEMFDDLLAAVQAPFRIDECAHVGTYFVHEHLADSFRVGNIFLAGDAAHEVTPLAGQGMNTGIQDGINLAWKMALVAAGDAGDELLDTYELERVLAARQADRLSESLTDWAIAVMGDAMAATDPSEIIRKVRTDLADMDYEQEAQVLLRYPPSPIARDWLASTPVAGQLYAGDRVPTKVAVELGDGHTGNLTDLLSERHFTTLVIDPTGTASPVVAGVRDAFDGAFRGSSVVHHLVAPDAAPELSVDAVSTIRADRAARELLSGDVPAVVVIRPDGYIAARIPLTDVDDLLPQFLEGISRTEV